MSSKLLRSAALAMSNKPLRSAAMAMRNRLVCRDQENMEFVIATIPTVLAIEESTRLLVALRKEGVPTHSMIVNQVIGDSMADRYLTMKLKEQSAAMDLLAGSEHLKDLEVIRGKLVDLEVRGVPALQYFATTLWQGLPLPAAAPGEGLVALGAPLTPFIVPAVWLPLLCHRAYRGRRPRLATASSHSVRPWPPSSCRCSCLPLCCGRAYRSTASVWPTTSEQCSEN